MENVKANISDIFVSIQGEGANVGCPALFIRVKECNLKCPFCDAVKDRMFSTEYTVKALVDRIKEKLAANPRVSKIVLTGGEPGLYYAFFKKVFSYSIKGVKTIDVETNGTLHLDWVVLSRMGDRTVHVHFSPKDILNSAYAYSSTLHSAYRQTTYCKLVVSSVEDAEAQSKKALSMGFPIENVFIQPVDANKELARQLIDANCFGCRLSMQIHKILEVK